MNNNVAAARAKHAPRIAPVGEIIRKNDMSGTAVNSLLRLALRLLTRASQKLGRNVYAICVCP